MAAAPPPGDLFDSLIGDVVVDARQSDSVSFELPKHAICLAVFEPLSAATPTAATTAAASTTAAEDDAPPDAQDADSWNTTSDQEPQGPDPSSDANAERHSPHEQHAEQDAERRFENARLMQSIPSPVSRPTDVFTIGWYPPPDNARFLTPHCRPTEVSSVIQREQIEMEEQAAQHAAEEYANSRKSTKKCRPVDCTVGIFEAGKSDMTTHIDLGFTLTWSEEAAPEMPCTTRASLRLDGSNCVPGTLRVGKLQEEYAPDVLRKLPAGLISTGKGVRYITVDYNARNVWATNLVVPGLDFGPHTEAMNKLRSFTVHGARIHLILAHSTSLPSEAKNWRLPVRFDQEATLCSQLLYWSDRGDRLEFRPGDLAPFNDQIERIAPLRPGFRDRTDFFTCSILPLVRDHQYQVEQSSQEILEQAARFVRMPGHPDRLTMDVKSFHRLEQTIMATDDLIQRELRADPHAVSVTGDIIFANRFDRLPMEDMFGGTTEQQLLPLRELLHKPQYPILDQVRHMPGGFALITGAAGSGKSTAVVLIAAFKAFVLSQTESITSKHGGQKEQKWKGKEKANAPAVHQQTSLRPALRLLCISPLNNNAEQNANSSRNFLAKVGIPDAIVIREYSKPATKAILVSNISLPGHAVNKYDDRTALSDLMEALPVDGTSQAGPVRMSNEHTTHQKRHFGLDKRVTPAGMEFSVANTIIELARLEPDKERTIPDPQLARLVRLVPRQHILQVQDAYRAYKQAQPDPTNEQTTALTVSYDLLREDILDNADVISTTCQLACDPHLWLYLRPRIIFLDEAFRCMFAESLAWVWYPTCRFRILAGDPMQSRAQCHSPPHVNALCSQMVLSLAAHLCLAGFPTTQLRHTYRFVEEIASVISNVFYGSRLICGTQLQPDERQVQHYTRQALKKLGSSSDVLLLNVSNTTTSKTESTQSSYNSRTALGTWFVVRWLLQYGVLPHQIIIVTPYIAQRTLHETTRSTFASKKNDPSILEILVETSERAQGQQSSVEIFDIPNTGQLGFAGHATKLCTGLTRGRLALILVCDVDKVERTKGCTTKAIGKLIHRFKMLGKVLRVEGSDLETRYMPDWIVTPGMTPRTENGKP